MLSIKTTGCPASAEHLPQLTTDQTKDNHARASEHIQSISSPPPVPDNRAFEHKPSAAPLPQITSGWVSERRAAASLPPSRWGASDTGGQAERRQLLRAPPSPFRFLLLHPRGGQEGGAPRGRVRPGLPAPPPGRPSGRFGREKCEAATPLRRGNGAAGRRLLRRRRAGDDGARCGERERGKRGGGAIA